MIYTTDNARGAAVHDVEAGKQLLRVVSIDTESGIVTMHHNPPRLSATRYEVETFEARFATIHPIYGGGKRPCLFHCYGRIS